MLLGKPLIAHSIQRAKESGLFEAVAVSSDSEDILAVAKEYGADYLIKRPDELATDQAAKIPAIKHCVAEVELKLGHQVEVVVDLDATSPLRSVEDIQQAVALLEESGAGNVITGMPARRSPYFNLVELNADGIAELSKPPKSAIVRRQDAPKCYDMNASIYVWRRHALFDGEKIFGNDTRLFVMPEERSIDIDSELDFKFVEFLMTSNAEKAT